MNVERVVPGMVEAPPATRTDCLGSQLLPPTIRRQDRDPGSNSHEHLVQLIVPDTRRSRQAASTGSCRKERIYGVCNLNREGHGGDMARSFNDHELAAWNTGSEGSTAIQRDDFVV